MITINENNQKHMDFDYIEKILKPFVKIVRASRTEFSDDGDYRLTSGKKLNDFSVEGIPGTWGFIFINDPSDIYTSFSVLVRLEEPRNVMNLYKSVESVLTKNTGIYSSNITNRDEGVIIRDHAIKSDKELYALLDALIKMVRLIKAAERKKKGRM